MNTNPRPAVTPSPGTARPTGGEGTRDGFFHMRREARPALRALDLFCCAGGATKGLQHAGFHVTGIDNRPQPNYCGDAFIQGDALNPPVRLADFDFIWASPPCQAYSNLTPADHREKHPALICRVRNMLAASGAAYCIENVSGAKRSLRAPLMLCGTMFGLRCQRHRYFETSWPWFDLLPPCDHSTPPLLVTTASKASRAKRLARGERPKSVENGAAAYGIDWMTGAELAESIPPAYSEFIGRAVIAAHGGLP